VYARPELASVELGRAADVPALSRRVAVLFQTPTSNAVGL
jgi:hypothetical protein